MEPGQERPLPIRNGNLDKLPINQSNTEGIIDRRNRSNLAVANPNHNPACTDQATQNSTEQDIIAVELPPFLRIPTEMRAKIFQYLLPNKSQNIEPTSVLYARREFLKEQRDEMYRRMVRYAHAQHRGYNALIGYSQFYGPSDPELHNTRFEIPFSTEEFAVPCDFSVEAFGDVYDMPETDGSSSSSFGDGISWYPPPSNAASASPPPLTEKLTAELEAIFGQTSTPEESSFWPDSTSSNRPHSNIFIDPPTPDQLTKIKKALKEEQYDALPTNTTLSLMTTHSLFATEIATILYEEYTFDIRVHDNGVDFLHLPRINTYEYFGNELAEQMAHFQAEGHFCLKRMRHVCFVLVGGDVKERTGAWRMRKNVQDLVGMLGDDLASLDIRFSGDDEFWIVNEEEKGVRARLGVKDVSVVEMVCSPLAAGLSGVGKVEVSLPEGLEEVEALIEWKKWFRSKIVGGGEVEKDGARELKEIAMFEATREWEYRQEILNGGKSYAYLEEMDVDTEDEEDAEMEDGIETD